MGIANNYLKYVGFKFKIKKNRIHEILREYNHLLEKRFQGVNIDNYLYSETKITLIGKSDQDYHYSFIDYNENEDIFISSSEEYSCVVKDIMKLFHWDTKVNKLLDIHTEISNSLELKVEAIATSKCLLYPTLRTYNLENSNGVKDLHNPDDEDFKREVRSMESLMNIIWFYENKSKDFFDEHMLREVRIKEVKEMTNIHKKMFMGRTGVNLDKYNTTKEEQNG